MRWTIETIEGHAFHRAELTRYGVRLALVVGPTADGRFQARCGGAERDTAEIATLGDYLATEPTAEQAKRVAAGWAEGV